MAQGSAKGKGKCRAESGFPDLHLKMSKKIAQLTKVIYHLNTKNDDHQHTALVEIPIPWMGAMKKGPFPLHPSLKEATAHRVLIKTPVRHCQSLNAIAPATRHICMRRGRRWHFARVAPLGGSPGVRQVFCHDHVGAAARAARDDAGLLFLSRRPG